MSEGRRGPSRGPRLFGRLVAARPGETAPMVWSAAYFFCLLCGYYILRPLRDEMGIQGGVRNLPWLNLATLAAIIIAHPLYSGLVSRLRPARFVPIVYRFFALNLLAFFITFRMLPADGQGSGVLLARIFYVWVSVFNLFAVTIFWSFLVDTFRSGQGKRLFGFVGAGGTLGAVAGSSLTGALAAELGTANLLLGSILFLELAVRCARPLAAWRSGSAADRDAAAPAASSRPPAPTGARAGTVNGEGIGRRSAAGLVEGMALVARSPYLLGICLFMLLYTFTSQFLYFQKAAIVAAHFSDSMERVTFFANLDRWVSLLTLSVQIFLTGRLVPWIGVALALALTPLVTAAGFVVLGLLPSLTVIALFEVTRKACNYAIARPAREILYTVTARREKYKAKSFIETFIYRGGDGLGSLAYGLLRTLDVALATLAFLAVPLALVWMVCGLWLGRRQARLAALSARGSLDEP